MLPIVVDVAIACEFDGASSSLQRALTDVVPDLIGHCCDVQIHEKLRDALKLLHGKFSYLKIQLCNRKNDLDTCFLNAGVSCSEVNRLTPLLMADSGQKTGRPRPAGDVPLGCGQVDSEVEFRGLKGCKTSH